MKRIAAIFVFVVISWAADTSAANYATNFDEFRKQLTLSGQDGGTGIFWDTNNYSAGPDGIEGTADDLGQSDYVGIVNGYSVTNADFWGLFGGGTGDAPIVDTSYLFRPVAAAGAAYADFSVRFGIISSQTPRLARDTFGWTFRDAAGQQLLRVSFVPHLTQLTQLTVRIYNAQNIELPGSGAMSIFYNSKYDLHVALRSTNTVSVTVGDSIGNAPIRMVIDQPLENVGGGAPVPSQIHDVAATWTLAASGLGGIGFGSNSLVFNNEALFLSQSPLPTSYAHWVTQRFAAVPDADSSPGGNADSDDLRNLWEYSSLTNPLTGDGTPLRIFTTNGQVRIQFLWNSHGSDISYQLQGGSNLSAAATWPLLGFDVVSQVMEGDAWRTTLKPLGVTGTHFFFKLRVNQSP